MNKDPVLASWDDGKIYFYSFESMRGDAHEKS
jgi:hypothetical protein